MKKKIAAAALALLLCLGALAPLRLPASAEGLSFISVNDTLPPELIGCAVNYGGTVYVPYYLFSNYGFGIYYSYFSAAATATLFNDENQIFFELNSGKTYDSDDYRYSVSAILRSGTVYVPLAFTARFFGNVGYSFISGNEYGSILRITDGTQVLSDEEFLRAARPLMQKYWTGAQTPPPTGTPVPTAAPPTPTPTPEPTEEPYPHEGEEITLAFVGLPSADVLTLLRQRRISTWFFLTAEEVRSAPDTVRRLLCEGHRVGVHCVGDAAGEFAETSELLFAAARVCTEFVTALPDEAGGVRDQAEAASLAFYGADMSCAAGESIYTITTQLDNGEDGAALLLGCGADERADLAILLNYLAAERFEIGAPRETD